VEIIAMPWTRAEYAEDVRRTRDRALRALNGNGNGDGG
jgi:hypothetical protein